MGKSPNLGFLTRRMGMIMVPIFRGTGKIYGVVLVTYIDLCLLYRKHSVKR